MAPDGVSRFIHVYEKYSIQGDTPELREEYRDFNFSQLTEMLQLPEGDHAMIRPETKREDIRDLKKFNKQSEHNPDNLLNWQQDPDEIIQEAVKEFFRVRKKDLNEIYEQYGIGPYPEEDIKKMARFLYHEKRRKSQNDRVFLMLYPDQVFIKSSDGELHDITWTEFFQVMGSIFDGSAAGKDTWKNYFSQNTSDGSEGQIPGQDNIMNHPEYLPGKLHGRKFEHCIYLPEEECTSEDCGSCEKKKLLDQQEAREQSDSRSGHCLYKPDLPCTLTEGQKRTPGTGENCSQKCCWNCTKHGDCKLECVASAKRVTKSEEIKELKKPDQEEKEYLEDQREEPETEIAPAQAEASLTESIHAEEIKAEELALGNISIQINTDVWLEDLSDIPIPSKLFVGEYLEEEEKMLKDYLDCDGLPDRTILRQQLKVAGLRIIQNLIKDILETEEKITQPELPRLKNNEERKEWLQNYRTWPLRHVDAYTGAKYYEYRFDNGAVLVAEEWKIEGDRYIPDRESVYLHLIGGPEAPRGKYGIRKWETHEKFNRFPDSETAIVEFLKAIQK